MGFFSFWHAFLVVAGVVGQGAEAENALIE